MKKSSCLSNRSIRNITASNSTCFIGAVDCTCTAVQSGGFRVLQHHAIRTASRDLNHQTHAADGKIYFCAYWIMLCANLDSRATEETFAWRLASVCRFTRNFTTLRRSRQRSNMFSTLLYALCGVQRLPVGQCCGVPVRKAIGTTHNTGLARHSFFTLQYLHTISIPRSRWPVVYKSAGVVLSELKKSLPTHILNAHLHLES